MMQPATIKLFLVNGSPDGLRTAEISNWTGKAVACPRSEIKALLEREECDGPGVYFLYGIDAETEMPALYIGEAEAVRKRLKQHVNKDFWTSAIAIISKDDNLTKAHVRYLEGLLIEHASSLRGIVLVNTVSGGAKLPESEQAEMDVFLDKIYQLLPVLGLSCFKPSSDTADSKSWLFIKAKGIEAKGRRTANGFLIARGSQTTLEPMPRATRMKSKRQKLIDLGVLEARENCLVFTDDYEFSSPSYAGSVVKGGAINGLKAWKNKQGISLKALESEGELSEGEE